MQEATETPEVCHEKKVVTINMHVPPGDTWNRLSYMLTDEEMKECENYWNIDIEKALASVV